MQGLRVFLGPWTHTDLHMHAVCPACYLGTPPRWGVKAQLQGCSNAAAQTRRKKSRQRDRAVSWEVMEEDTVHEKKAERLASLPTLTPLQSQHLPSHRLHQCLLKGNHASPPSPSFSLACASCAFTSTSCPPALTEGDTASTQSFCDCALWPHLSGEGKWALTGMKLALM